MQNSSHNILSLGNFLLPRSPPHVDRISLINSFQEGLRLTSRNGEIALEHYLYNLAILSIFTELQKIKKFSTNFT